jgi:hypothetical protein
VLGVGRAKSACIQQINAAVYNLIVARPGTYFAFLFIKHSSTHMLEVWQALRLFLWCFADWVILLLFPCMEYAIILGTVYKLSVISYNSRKFQTEVETF